MYKINNHASIDIFEDGAIIQLKEEFYAVDLIAYEMLEKLIEMQNTDEVLASIEKTYFVDIDTAARDLHAILKNYKEIGVLEEPSYQNEKI